MGGNRLARLSTPPCSTAMHMPCKGKKAGGGKQEAAHREGLGVAEWVQSGRKGGACAAVRRLQSCAVAVCDCAPAITCVCIVSSTK